MLIPLQLARVASFVLLIISSIMFQLCFYTDLYGDALIFFFAGVFNVYSVVSFGEKIAELRKKS